MTANPLQLHFIPVPLVWPHSAPIRAEVLRAPLALAQELQIARASLDDVRQQAEVMRVEAERMAQAVREDMLALAQAECDVLRQQAREAAVGDAVQWMVREAELESEVARRLMQRWRPLLTRVIEAISAQRDQSELYLQQVEQQVLKLLPQGRLKLMVPIAQQSALSAVFEHLTMLTVEGDVALSEGQAVLDNGLVRVWLDLPAYRRQLLRQLEGVAEELGCD